MSPIIPSKYGHPKYNIFPQKSRAASMGGFKTNQRGTPGIDSKSRRKQRVEESKITVQPTEEDEADNFFSKHLAAARFQRNHRLINVLFSEIVVDQDQPSDNDKLNSCRERVKSLTKYQKKIDDEIVEMNDKFNSKRVKIVDDGKKFAEKLTEFIASSKKELEVLKATREIRRQQEAIHRQQTKTQSVVNNTSESKTLPSSNGSSVVPMEGVTNLDEHNTHKSDIRLVIDGLISSIADRV